ncbi:MAG: TIGR00266 family protein [Candidatus Cloacimonadales bacterium]
MADVIDYQLHGDDMQIVEIELDPGEAVRAEAGAMLYMESGIEMNTSTGGGLLKGFKRALTGESFFITDFIHQGSGKAHVAFSAPYPGKIIPLDLQEYDNNFICQKDAFLCAAKGTEINIEFTKKLGAGLFGGEGFILQHLSGDGLAFIHVGGTVIKKELEKGETLRIDTGCIAGFSQTISYDIQLMRGFKNALFGGEGLFLATLRGPGIVFLQSLPLSRLANRISAGLSHNKGEQKGVAGLGGNILGSLLSGDN